MDSLTLEKFRCFNEEQTARLAPLTLLVGENSAGKTSFLALVRAMQELAFSHKLPDFKREPYDLGSFDEVANYRGGKAGRANEFTAGFTGSHRGRSYSFTATFRRQGSGPAPVQIKIERRESWLEFEFPGSKLEVRYGTPNGSWFQALETAGFRDMELRYYFWALITADKFSGRWTPTAGSVIPTEADIEKAKELFRLYDGRFGSPVEPFASAPVRSRPRRTYDPEQPAPDPEGKYIPMLFAGLYFQAPEAWEKLKSELESFGRAAGLFDEIIVRPLGKRGADPFQLQIRKFGKQIKGPNRNLIDVGYGVSQVLPVITELLHSNGPAAAHLLQQPEVHLHPSAQAALGSLFCQIACPNRQLIVETHSDYLLDRVRMDVRDGVAELKPKDVSILYFEKQDIDVRIHSLRLDAEGNVLDAPPSYGNFFMEEVARSVWKRDASSER